MARLQLGLGDQTAAAASGAVGKGREGVVDSVDGYSPCEGIAAAAAPRV